MTHYLYRKAGRGVILVLAVVALASGLAPAQSKKKQRGPRALALLELPADPKLPPRLIPIAIFDNNRYFDASLYLATPRPLALDPGNVYEAERDGRAVGLFTVEAARQINEAWIGEGRWRPYPPEAKAGAAAPKTPSAPPGADEDAPPVLRRGDSTPPAARTGTEQKREPSSAPTAPPSQPAEKEDADRPTLRRGKPAPAPRPEEVSAPPKAPPAASKVVPPARSRQPEFLVAISDAGGPEFRLYQFAWSPEEQQRLSQAVAALASAEVGRYARSMPGVKFGPAASFEDVRLRAFDLGYDNNAELVFSARVPRSAPRQAPSRSRAARAPEPPARSDFFFYVTVVARVDLEGQPRLLFSSVTDTSHLDSFPRLELVDAVDASGSGRGDLLFRALSDTGRTCQLYRVTRDRLFKLFEGGSSAE